MSAPSDQTRYELFISYARKDNITAPAMETTGRVTAIRDYIVTDHRRFSAEPLRIFFDMTEIADMSDWRHRILSALRSLEVLLVCLSSDCSASDYCRSEWDEYMACKAQTLPGSDERINAARLAGRRKDRQRSSTANLPRHTRELVSSQKGLA